MSATPNIPEKGWTNPFPDPHPLHDLYEKRISNNQDLVILIDDWHSRRGTGKSVASLQLAEGMDQNGGITYENVTLAPEKLRNAYATLPKRSSLVFDEGELGASNRQAMTKTNQALREIMSIGRVEQKYVIINTPSIGFIDKDIVELADVWICMVGKGVGVVFYLKRNPFASGDQTLTEENGTIKFRDIQKGTRLREVYNQATKEKKAHIDGEESNEYVPLGEHKEELQKAREEARQDMRNEIITDIYNRLSGFDEDDITRIKRTKGISQSMIGEAVGLTQQQIGNIVRNND